MAEKPGELIKDATRDDAILTDTDKDAISAVAGAYNDDAFVEKYTEETDSSSRQQASAEAIESDGDDEDTETEETEHLKAQIEETRSQMGETIDAIQEKLSFQNISDQVKEQVSEQISQAYETVKESVYDATIKKAGKFMQSMNKTVNEGLDEITNSDVMRTVRANPLPLALIGLGVGMLIMNGYRSKSSSRHYAYGNGEGNGKSRNQPSTLRSAQNAIAGTAGSAYESVSDAASSAYGTVSDTASSAYGKVSNAASAAASGVSSAASTAAGTVSNVAGSAYEGVTNFAGTAYDKVGEFGSQARETYDHHIEENPLAVGAVALALGAAVGMAFPTTRYEGQIMGETKQNLLNLAQDRAGELVDKVKQVASDAGATLQEEVSTNMRGLTQ